MHVCRYNCLLLQIGIRLHFQESYWPGRQQNKVNVSKAVLYIHCIDVMRMEQASRRGLCDVVSGASAPFYDRYSKENRKIGERIHIWTLIDWRKANNNRHNLCEEDLIKGNILKKLEVSFWRRKKRRRSNLW